MKKGHGYLLSRQCSMLRDTHSTLFASSAAGLPIKNADVRVGIEKRKEVMMTKFVKPIFILFLAAVFVALAIAPPAITAKDVVTMRGYKTSYLGIDTCVCPYELNYNCQCMLLLPVD